MSNATTTPEGDSAVLELLHRISNQVTGVEAKIDANAQAMEMLTAKLDQLEGAVEQLERDVRGAKFSALLVGGVSGGTVSLIVAVGWELLKARIGG